MVVVGNVFLSWMLRLRTVPETLDKMRQISFQMHACFARFASMSIDRICDDDPFEEIGELLLAHRRLATELEEVSVLF